MIVVDGLVFAVIEPFVMSVAVKVAVPAVFGVTEKRLRAGDERCVRRAASRSRRCYVIPTVSVELTRFQFASTALTVTLNEVPAVCADGVPVLPVAVPGAAVSPGSRICSFANAPALIVVDGLVFAVIAPLRDVRRREGRGAGGLRRDREGLRAGDECGVARAASRWRRSR